MGASIPSAVSRSVAWFQQMAGVPEGHASIGVQSGSGSRGQGLGQEVGDEGAAYQTGSQVDDHDDWPHGGDGRVA